MTPWYIATQPFTPADGDRWLNYVDWSGLTQLTEVVSLDGTLCPTILGDLKDDYWPHIVNEDFMLDFFLDLEFLEAQVANFSRKNMLCVIRNPVEEPTQSLLGDFQLLGYDLVGVQDSISALTNCGGFSEVFANSELSYFGLLDGFRRAREVQRALRSRFPEEPHANCHLWAVARRP